MIQKVLKKGHDSKPGKKSGYDDAYHNILSIYVSRISLCKSLTEAYSERDFRNFLDLKCFYEKNPNIASKISPLYKKKIKPPL